MATLPRRRKLRLPVYGECLIDGLRFDDSAGNQGNVCQYCSVSNSVTCRPGGSLWCREGVCWDLGDRCNLGQPGYCRNCSIGGEIYRHADRNPFNGCEQCNADLSPKAWSFVDPNYWCDLDARDAICCNGFCCAAGQFCNIDGCFCDA
jgi:hypothetical protein